MRDAMSVHAQHAVPRGEAIEPPLRPRLVLLVTSLGVLLAQIDTSVVNLALKSIGTDLNTGVSALQWVIDAYNSSTPACC